MMKTYLAVALGGAFGSAARFLFVSQAARLLQGVFPWGTLGVNVTGSLLMGIAVAWFAARVSLPPEMQAFVCAGVLGGFTTFSAFSLEVVLLFERGLIFQALLYSIASFGLSSGALMAGLIFTRRWVAE